MTRNCLNVLQKHANIDKKAQGWFRNYVASPVLALGHGIAEDGAIAAAASPTMVNNVYRPALTRIGLPALGTAVSRVAPLIPSSYIGASLAVPLGLAAGEVIKSTVTEPYMQAPGEGVHQADDFGDSIRSSERMADPATQQEMNYYMNQVNARRKAKGLPVYNSSKYGGNDQVKPSGALGTWTRNNLNAVADTVNPSRRKLTTHVSAPTQMQIADHAHNESVNSLLSGRRMWDNKYTQFNAKDTNLMKEYQTAYKLGKSRK